jgi:hypothetical protein
MATSLADVRGQGGATPWACKHFQLPWCRDALEGRDEREGEQRAVVHPLHLVTNRPGRRWLVRRAFVMWGHVFDDTLATSGAKGRRAVSCVSCTRRVGASGCRFG